MAHGLARRRYHGDLHAALVKSVEVAGGLTNGNGGTLVNRPTASPGSEASPAIAIPTPGRRRR